MSAPVLPLPKEQAAPRRRGRGAWITALLLAPPLLWLGVIYLGSLLGLLLYGFYSIDDFTAQVVQTFTWATFASLLSTPSNLDVILRTLLMSLAVTLACAVIAFPLARYVAMLRGRQKALWVLLITLPLWASYLVRVYAWRLILAQEGVLSWVFAKLHLTWLLDAALRLPVLGGPSLSSSYLGMFLVFVYVWLPYMILPLYAGLERVPRSLLEASADLGARNGTTFRRIVLPLVLPALVAGSIFTFSLTLGDYITPGLVSNNQFIGNVVFEQQGVSGNLPLAAAFALVPVAIMTVYLFVARRLGAFEAL